MWRHIVAIETFLVWLVLVFEGVFETFDMGLDRFV